MFGFVRHPVFLTIGAIVVICFFAGGAAAGGHLIAGWGHDVVEFFHGLSGR